MKILLLLISVIAISLVSAQATNTVNLTVNGVSRTFRLYVPAIYNPGTAVPLVFNFHGYGSNSSEQEIYGDFRPIADTANFIIAHPQGLVVNGSTGWNNFALPSAADDDLDFVSAMITLISTQYSIDPDRIYSTGMSNGGFMSYDLACFLSSRFAAIVSVAGGLTVLHKNACQAAHPTPVMQIHGTTDAVVSYTGGAGGFGMLHVDSLIKFWVQFNHCDPIPAFTALQDINTADNCTAEHYVYSGGLLGSTVEFYKIINGGHTWPGALFPVSGNTNMDFSASKEIWRFFSKYRLNELTANVSDIGPELKVSVYPNPAQGSFTVETENFAGLKIDIYDETGKLVHTQPLESKSAEIRFHSEKGMYIYKICDSRTMISSGKIAIR